MLFIVECIRTSVHPYIYYRNIPMSDQESGGPDIACSTLKGILVYVLV